jgi:hypothetical protein
MACESNDFNASSKAHLRLTASPIYASISLGKNSLVVSLGRDLDPGPLPYQGNALPG